MGDIYTITQNTVLWPGLISTLAAGNHHLLQQTRDCNDNRTAADSQEEILCKLRSEFDRKDKSIQESWTHLVETGEVDSMISENTWHGLLEMMLGNTILVILAIVRKSYWKRLWILQELSFGQSRTLIFLTSEAQSLQASITMLDAIAKQCY